MNRLHHTHLTWCGTKLLETSHEPDKSDDECGYQVLGQALVLTVAEGRHGLRPALRVELIGVDDLFRVATSFALDIILEPFTHTAGYLQRLGHVQEA